MIKFWHVLWYTYLKTVKSKAFIFSTIITCILILSLTNTNQEAAKEVRENVYSVGILNEWGEEDVFDNRKIKGKKVKSEEEAIVLIKKREIDAFVHLYMKDGERKVLFKALQLMNTELISLVKNDVQTYKEKNMLKNYGMKSEHIEEMKKEIKVETKALEKQAKSEEEIQQSSLIVFFMLLLIYATVVFYGSSIAVEVASEKSSRMMEILISSVEPVKQMYGKIIGIAFVGMTQYGIFFLFAAGIFKNSEVRIDAVPKETFFFAVLFFILGYFLYAAIMAMMGSLVSRIEEVHQAISPINIVVITGFILSIVGLADPTSTIVTVSSFIPFFTPMIMFLRIAIIEVPMWQILTSIVGMMVSILLFSLLAAKIYRGGVLLYGKISWKMIIKALKIQKK